MDFETKKLVSVCMSVLNKTKKGLDYLGERGLEELPKKGEPLTKGDLAVSKIIRRNLIGSGLPLMIMSEESEIYHPSNPKYIVGFDEVDGTSNYLRGGILPYCTVIYAFPYTKEPTYNDCIFAAVMDHTKPMLWHAIKGEGCFLNNKRVYACRRKKMGRETSIIIDLGPCPSLKQVKQYEKIYTSSWVKNISSAGIHLAGISSGNFDGFLSEGQKAHELGAGYLLLKESGAYLSDWKGKSFDDVTFEFNKKYPIVASATPELGKLILSKLKK